MDEVARWLVDSARLPQYEQAFRDNDVDGPMLLDIVANAMLAHLVENPLHQCRVRSQLATFERRACAAAGGTAEAPASEYGGESEGEGNEVRAPGTRRAAVAALADGERSRKRLRHSGEPAGASASAGTSGNAAATPLVAVESPAHGVLVYVRPPLADLEARPLLRHPPPGAHPGRLP